MSQSAQAMASLIISTEAKGLMSLFVTTRKLKKVALNFGIESDEMTLPFDHQKYSVMVLMSREFLGLSSAVIQCLLYNEIPVCVCVTDKNFNTAKVFKRVQSHFDYALKRQYMSQLEVGERMQLLSCCTTSGLIDCLVKMEHNSLILISASSKKVSIGDIVKYFTKVNQQNYMSKTNTCIEGFRNPRLRGGGRGLVVGGWRERRGLYTERGYY